MARLWSSGFELNSLSTGVEWDKIINSNVTLSTTTVRSGGFSLKAQVFSGFSYVGQQISASSKGPFFARIYLNIATAPTVTNGLMGFATSFPSWSAFVAINSDLTLSVWKDVTAVASQIGSNSAALNLNQWYRVEMWFNGTPADGSKVVKVAIDGVEFVSSSAVSMDDIGTSGYFFTGLGLGGKTSANTTGTWYIDDVAINDSTGSFQNSYPGSGKLIHLIPDSAGDVNTFVTASGGTAGTSNNFTRVKEVTPDDATTSNGATAINQEDLFNCSASGIGASDTVNVVAVGLRVTNIGLADATTAVKAEIEKTASSTIAQGTAIIPNSTTWRTNAASAPFNYSLTTYQDPTTTNWTQTTLDSMQIGYKETAFGTIGVTVSTVWALVDYTPAVAPSAPGVGSTMSMMGVG